MASFMVGDMPIFVNLPQPVLPRHQENLLSDEFEVETNTTDANIRIKHRASGEMLFVGVRLKPLTPTEIANGITQHPTDIYTLHQRLMEVSKSNHLIPSITQPNQFPQPPDTPCVIAFRCVQRESLAQLEARKLFRYVQTYNSVTRSWEEKPNYVTRFCKNVILTFLNSILTYEITRSIYPVLDPALMFVSEDTIIYTQYHKSKPTNYDEETVKDVLRAILSKIGNTSETLTYEFDDLYQWVTNWWKTKGNVGSAMDLALFLTPKLRSLYVTELAESAMNGNAYSIHRDSSNAFRDPNVKGHWRDVVINKNHPILLELLSVGDLWYQTEYLDPTVPPPHPYRTDTMVPNSNVVYHSCCLVRMCDGSRHHRRDEVKLASKYPTVLGDLAELKVNEGKVTDIHLQEMFQDVFPRHVVDLLKARHFTSFNVREKVVEALRRRR